MPTLTVLNSLLLSTLLPLAGFLVLLFWGRRFGREGRAAGVVGTILALASFALSVTALVFWVAKDGFQQPNYVEAFTHRWINLPSQPVESLRMGPLAAPPEVDGISAGCLIDSLTIVMFVILTLINVLVHIFALGSTSSDENTKRQRGGRPRFFALLQLFNFALLAFLLANSLVQMLVFWSLTSIAAYFVIRLTTPENDATLSKGSLRMFLMNAAGDAAFLLGIGLLLLHTGSLSGLSFFDARGNSILSATVRDTMNVQSSEYLFLPGGDGFLHLHWLTWAGVCFLIAALARMAQFPFQTWMHDVAEVPAPVAALLLGTSTLATGTFLLAHLYPILTVDARFIAAVLGCVTLATGALVALVQTDIHKILAWSTVSQGGFILLFLGVGGYAAGVLHLFTHAFIKTALFLAAGSILQGLSPSTGLAQGSDIRQLGGLWKRFPITAVASLIAVLSLAGAPWLSGAYSTNLGLACVYEYAQALHGDNPNSRFAMLLFWVPAIITYITALGIGRWWWLIFAGTNRNAKLSDTAHEAAFLTLPIVILGGVTVSLAFEFSGVILPLIVKSIPLILLPANGVPLVFKGSEVTYAIVIRAVGWAFLGLVAAVFLYAAGFTLPNRLRRLPGIGLLDYWLRERMFLDDLYESVAVTGLFCLVRAARGVERVGRAIVKLTILLFSLLVAAISRLERAHQLPPSAPTLPNEQHESEKATTSSS